MNASLDGKIKDEQAYLLNPEDPEDNPRLGGPKKKSNGNKEDKEKKEKKEKKDKKDKKGNKEKKEERERKRLCKDLLKLDYYSAFKLFGPIIPTLPSIYAIIASMFQDTSHSNLSNWYKVFDFIENLNVCIYSVAATIFYGIFKKKKKAKDLVRRGLARRVQKLNTFFLVYCFICSAVKLVLGILLPPLDDVPDQQAKGLFYFSLFSKIGLIIGQLYYLHNIYVKKYYKALPILEDAADDGYVNDSKKKKDKKKVDDDTKDNGKDIPDPNPDEKDKDKEKAEENGKGKDEEEEKEKRSPKKKGENGKESEKQNEEIIEMLRKTNNLLEKAGDLTKINENFQKVYQAVQENNKVNEKVLDRVEGLDEVNKGWEEMKEELLMIRKQNMVLLKFSKPLMEDVELKILNQTDNQSFEINVKVYDSVEDVKEKIVEKLELSKKGRVVLKTSKGELEDESLIGEYDLDNIKQGLLLNYYESKD